MIPQFIILALMFSGLGLVIAKHGQPRDPWCAWSYMISCALQLGLLYWGGFFNCFFGATP